MTPIRIPRLDKGAAKTRAAADAMSKVLDPTPRSPRLASLTVRACVRAPATIMAGPSSRLLASLS